MKNKKRIILKISVLLLYFFILENVSLAAEPKLISTLNNAFEKIEDYIIKI